MTEHQRKANKKKQKKPLNPANSQILRKPAPFGLVERSFGLDDLPDHATVRELRRGALLQMQQSFGNSYVQRFLVARRRQADAVAPLDVAPKPLGPAASMAPGDGLNALQRWAEKEHKRIGDEATGGKAYKWGPSGKSKFELTHGDLVFLSGDHFDPRDKRRNPDTGKMEPNPDSLFRIAGRISSNPGKVVGTQDEIIFAIWDNVPADSRFKKGGIWEWASKADAFDPKVKKAVQDRYLRLAAVNVAHFVSPKGKPASAKAKLGSSAGGSYRALHEDAIIRAFTAGQNGEGSVSAMTREAAAQHFLTDAFSAGHVRTPIVSIRDFWMAKYPLFWGNFKKKIAMDTARYANAHESGLSTAFGTVLMIYDQIYGALEEKAASMPPIGFGDVVGRIVHDLDSQVGVNVINDAGQAWKAYGDGKLAVDKKTRDKAILAVKLGIQDIGNAHALGKAKPGPIDPDWVYNEVKNQAGSPATPGVKYAPEQLIPREDKSKEKSKQNWKAASFEKLWNVPVRSDKASRTFGIEIGKALGSKGAFGKQLDAFEKEFPAEQSGIHPQKAYANGFLKPLRADPLKGLRGIIDYNPSIGQSYENVDDAALEYLRGLTDEQLRGLTLNQRAKHIKAMIGGSTGTTEEKMVVMLFATARAGDRKKLYKKVEGHSWKGKWKEGYFVSDDDIWNALSRDRLRTLRKIINGGAGPKAGTGYGKKPLEAMTTDKRAKKVKKLIGGWKTDDWEGERVILIFKHTKPKERPNLYKKVEGHAWGGNFISGKWVSDDDLHNALTAGQLMRLRQLINEGK